MAEPFIHARMVEFADTDAAGLMHFSNFFRFMESAEHALLRSLGHSVHQVGEDGLVGFVRVHAACDYRKPLRFEQMVSIEVRVHEVNSKSIVYDFVFRSDDQDSAEQSDAADDAAALGSMTVVCVRKDHASGNVRAIEIPGELAAKLRSRLIAEAGE